MARVPAGLPAGVRPSDHVSLGVIAGTFPLDQVQQVLAETGRASERECDLPAHVMVYYAIALALYAGAGTREVPRCLLKGLRWLWGAEAVRVAGKSGISQRPAPASAGRRCAACKWRARCSPTSSSTTPPTSGSRWRRRHATGDMIVVRYADDQIVGFEHRRDAERFLADLRERLARSGSARTRRRRG